METRVDKVAEKHKSGYNCAQAVACAYCDLVGIDEETMFRMTEGLGLGMGGMEGTCGAISAAAVLAGLKISTADLEKPNSKGTSYKCNMTDIMASIGLVQLKRYPGLLKRRRDIIERYTQGIAADDVDIMKHFTDEYTSSGHLYLVRLLGKDVKERNELITRLAEAGVATNVHFKPLPMHTAYKNMGFDIKDFPHSYNMYRNEITLPLHTCLTDEQVEYVIEQFNRMK